MWKFQTWRIAYIYWDGQKLTQDIRKVLPSRKSSAEVKINECFGGCPKITCKRTPQRIFLERYLGIRYCPLKGRRNSLYYEDCSTICEHNIHEHTHHWIVVDETSKNYAANQDKYKCVCQKENCVVDYDPGMWMRGYNYFKYKRIECACCGMVLIMPVPTDQETGRWATADSTWTDTFHQAFDTAIEDARQEYSIPWFYRGRDNNWVQRVVDRA